MTGPFSGRGFENTMGEWFADESLWIDLYPFSFPEERLQAGAEEVGQLLTLVGTEPAGRAVLDLCCGPGRHAVPLASRGARVTGVDRTRFQLGLAQPTRSRGLPDGTVLIDRSTVVDDWTRVENHGILIRDGRSRTFLRRLNVYSGLELRDRLLQAGFAAVRLYGGLDGRPYDLDAARLVAVARADA